MGGLSTAHYLADTCDVTVYEAQPQSVGGKAKSVRNADGTPAEHGFRYFPGYYEYIPGIMREIPWARNVADNLVEAEVTQILRTGQAPVPLANKVSRGFLDAAQTMGQLLQLDIPIEELAVFGAQDHAARARPGRSGGTASTTSSAGGTSPRPRTSRRSTRPTWPTA